MTEGYINPFAQQPANLGVAPAVSEFDPDNPGATTNFGGVKDLSSGPIVDKDIVGDPARGGEPISEYLAKVKAAERGGPVVIVPGSGGIVGNIGDLPVDVDSDGNPIGSTVVKDKSNYSKQHLNDLHDKVIAAMDNRPESEIPLADPYWAVNNAYRQALKSANLL